MVGNIHIYKYIKVKSESTVFEFKRKMALFLGLTKCVEKYVKIITSICKSQNNRCLKGDVLYGHKFMIER